MVADLHQPPHLHHLTNNYKKNHHEKKTPTLAIPSHSKISRDPEIKLILRLNFKTYAHRFSHKTYLTHNHQFHYS